MDSDKNDKLQGTLVQNVVQSLIAYIRDHNLKIGDKLPSEIEFTRKLNVSRTVVREAFKILTAMHIIEVSAGRRAQISGFDDSVMTLSLSHGLRIEQITPQQLWDARRAIETRTVELACQLRSEKQADHLLELTDKMRATYQDLTVMTEYDIAFHVAIAEATCNPLFPVLVSSLTAAIRETNPLVWKTRKEKAQKIEVADWHTAIAEGIKEQNPKKALYALNKHFDEAIKGLSNAGFS